MPKMIKRNRSNENLSEQEHVFANKYMGPTRKEPIDSRIVGYILPDLDPMQKQLNRIENTMNHEARCRNRRNWKCKK